jgi:BMFP domain-containing protein YqiC
MKQKTEQLSARLDVVTRENQELKAQLLEQTKVLADMKSVAEVIKARMNVLEQQRGVAVQAAAFTVPMGARAGATE